MSTKEMPAENLITEPRESTGDSLRRRRQEREKAKNELLGRMIESAQKLTEALKIANADSSQLNAFVGADTSDLLSAIQTQNPEKTREILKEYEEGIEIIGNNLGLALSEITNFGVAINRIKLSLARE